MNNDIYSAKRAINFDLDINAIEKWHIKPYNSAYNEIKKVMTKLGFSHRQGSGYISENEFSNREIRKLANDIADYLPWLSKCLSNIDVTDIVNTHSILNNIKNRVKRNININKYETLKPLSKNKP